jgi:MtfA peptidase
MPILKHLRRRRLRRKPFPPIWRRYLEENVPIYRRLPEEDQRELEMHVQIFLAEKYFEGCGGLTLTDEMRTTIAAQACMLLLHRETDYYPGLRTILVYPAGYFARSRNVGPGGVVTESVDPRLGESWHTPGAGGPVVLSWRDVKAGAANDRDGHNVVYHEFAHQLDGESGSVEGAPRLQERSQYTPWAQVFGREFQRLHAELRSGQPTLLNPYGASSPAEFFAVATETFFERPLEMRARHPALYEQLRGYYRQDPARLFEGERAGA